MVVVCYRKDEKTGVIAYTRYFFINYLLNTILDFWSGNFTR